MPTPPLNTSTHDSMPLSWRTLGFALSAMAAQKYNVLPSPSMTWVDLCCDTIEAAPETTLPVTWGSR